MLSAISQRCQFIGDSATLVLAAKAKQLEANGTQIFNLTVGEPDIPTPQHIKAAAIKAIHNNFTHYTATDGIPELKQAIVEKFAHENQLQYQREQVLVSCGAKHSLYNLCQALLNSDDEALIPAPYWVSYPEMVKLTGANPVIIKSQAENGFKITAEQLERAINNKTKLLFLNSPSNPSGAVYSREELATLGAVLEQHPEIIIASDDIYEHIYWDAQPFTNIVNACPQLYEQTVVINGPSKAYAMTGWRIGYAAGPATIIAAMKKIQAQSTSCPNSIAQHATIAALNGTQEFLQQVKQCYQQRQQLLTAKLAANSLLQVIPATATFYVFINITKLLAKMHLPDDKTFCAQLLEKTGIATVPGSAFGIPQHLRISYAIEDDVLNTAIENFIAAI